MACTMMSSCEEVDPVQLHGQQPVRIVLVHNVDQTAHRKELYVSIYVLTHTYWDMTTLLEGSRGQ